TGGRLDGGRAEWRGAVGHRRGEEHTGKIDTCADWFSPPHPPGGRGRSIGDGPPRVRRAAAAPAAHGRPRGGEGSPPPPRASRGGPAARGAPPSPGGGRCAATWPRESERGRVPRRG